MIRILVTLYNSVFIITLPVIKTYSDCSGINGNPSNRQIYSMTSTRNRMMFSETAQIK